MASICVHRATRTPLDSTPGHIGSRDGLQEDHRPATHSRAGTASPFPAIHLTRQSPFYGPPGHIRSRDGLQEDHRPATHGHAGTAFPFPAIHLTRQSPFYGPAGHIRSRDGLQEDHRPATHGRQSPVSDWLVPGPTLSCNSSDKAIAILRASRAHPLARWHQFVSIERPEPL